MCIRDRLDPICAEVFGDIDKDVVDFVPNYDGELMEPTLLPVAFPNILVSPNPVSYTHLHAKIEVEFDRSLLVRQGIDPVKADLVQHIHPSKESAFVISQFFPQISEKEIDQCIKSMRFYNHLLRAPGKFKRCLLYTSKPSATMMATEKNPAKILPNLP